MSYLRAKRKAAPDLNWWALLKLVPQYPVVDIAAAGGGGKGIISLDIYNNVRELEECLIENVDLFEVHFAIKWRP